MARLTQDARTEPRSPMTRQWAVGVLVAMVIGVFVFLVLPLVVGSMLSLDYVEFWDFFVLEIGWAGIRETWQGKLTAGIALIFVGVFLRRRTRAYQRTNTNG